MVQTGHDEPDDGLPRVLEERLAAFPIAAIRDGIDRLAAMAEEMRQAAAIVDGLGLDDVQQRHLLRAYLQALDACLIEAGKSSPRLDRPRTGLVRVARPRGVPRSLFFGVRWLAARVAGPAAAWVSNRRVGWRRRRWRRLLVH